MHFIHISISIPSAKIDELRYLAKMTAASISGIGETKIDDSISSNEVKIEDYDPLRFDQSC